MIRIIKTFLVILGIIWLVIEAVNLNGYFISQRIPMPHKYRPVVIQVIYENFPLIRYTFEKKSNNNLDNSLAKPVIYLYPEVAENIQVSLNYKGKIIADYPAYDYSINGWYVTAYPDGKIIDKDGKEFSYLFWEGESYTSMNYDLSTGFVVKGEDTISFLQNTLSKMGLTPKEYNEFIVYWYPKMKDNKYNLIHFAEKEYTDNAPLEITPKPDSILRVFMVYKPLDEYLNIKPQEIKGFERNGFSVIEWGGTKL